MLANIRNARKCYKRKKLLGIQSTPRAHPKHSQSIPREHSDGTVITSLDVCFSPVFSPNQQLFFDHRQKEEDHSLIQSHTPRWPHSDLGDEISEEIFKDIQACCSSLCQSHNLAPTSGRLPSTYFSYRAANAQQSDKQYSFLMFTLLHMDSHL